MINVMIYVGSCIIVCCFDSFAAYMICKQDFKYIGVIKGLKMGFLDENGVRNRRLNSAQMSTRSSEMPFAQASNTLLRPV